MAAAAAHLATLAKTKRFDRHFSKRHSLLSPRAAPHTQLNANRLSKCVPIPPNRNKRALVPMWFCATPNNRRRLKTLLPRTVHADKRATNSGSSYSRRRPGGASYAHLLTDKATLFMMVRYGQGLYGQAMCNGCE